MATVRFYLANKVLPGGYPNPAPLPGYWDVNPAGAQPAYTHKQGTSEVPMAAGMVLTAAAPRREGARNHISDAGDLPVGLLAGTFRCITYYRSHNGVVPSIRLSVISSDGATHRGFLWSGEPTLTGWTSPSSGQSPDTVIMLEGELTPVEVQAGDRLLIERGFYFTSGTAWSRSGSFVGTISTTLPDLTLADVGSTGVLANSWLDIIPIDPPNPPTGLTQTRASSDTVTVAWTPPASGPAPEAYEVRLSSGAWVDVGLVTSHTFTGLYPETGYPVEVRAYAGGFYSTSVSITATTTEYVPPPESPSCFTPIRGSVLRVTELDHCGSYASQNVRFATTSGIIKVTVEEETTSQSAETFRTPEGELRMVLRKGTQPIRNTVDIEFIKVEPHVLELVAGVIPVVHPGDNVVGFDNLVRRKPVSFALEVWSKLTTKDCDEQQQWGHTLFPHLRGGRLKGFAFTNGLVSFTLVGAQTRRSGNWGVGPHEVQDWVEPVSRNTNFRLTTTPVPPPASNCEMQLALPAP